MIETNEKIYLLKKNEGDSNYYNFIRHLFICNVILKTELWSK